MRIQGGLLRYLRVPRPGGSAGLRPRMIVYFGLPFVAIVIAMIYAELFGVPLTGFDGAVSDLRAEAFSDLDLVADLKQERLENWLEQRRADATVLAEGENFQRDLRLALLDFEQARAGGASFVEVSRKLRSADGVYRRLTQHLTLIRDTYGIYDSIEIVDPRTGVVFISTDEEAVGRTVSGQEHFQSFMKPGSSGEYIHVMPSSDQAPGQASYPELYISRRIAATGIDGQGLNETPLVLIMQVELDEVIGPLPHTGDGLGQTGEALLVNQEVKILTSLAHPLADGSRAEPLHYQITAAPAMYAAAGQSGITSSRDYRGEQVLAAYRYIPITPELGWGLVVKQDAAEIFSALRERVAYTAWIGAAGAVFVLVLAFVVATGLTRPIRMLESAATRFGRGDRTVRVPETSGGEIGRLAHEFNKMATSLNQREEELSIRVAALDAAAEMVVITDSEGTIEYVNRAFTEGTGYGPKEVVGSNPRVLSSGRQDSEFYRDLWKTITSGKAWNGTLINRRKDGSEYPEEMTVTPVMDSDGKIFRIIAIKRDISERLQIAAERETARDMEASNNELQRINEARSEFLSTISHELRTPLTAMLAFSDILRHNKDGNLNARQIDQLERISEGGRRLDELIEELLDVSRSETGRFKLEIATFDIRETIEEVAGLIRSVFDQRGQTLKVANLPGPTWLNGDRRRVIQVISNILANAAKYSPDGTAVDLVVTVEQDSVHVVVRDQGIGISRADQQRLFDPFFRVENEETRKVPGSGLGLVIVKAIVELHGGRVELESQQGVGTTVRIQLPGILPNPQCQLRAADADAAGVRSGRDDFAS